jgi:hypothetical protein
MVADWHELVEPTPTVKLWFRIYEESEAPFRTELVRELRYSVIRPAEDKIQFYKRATLRLPDKVPIDESPLEAEYPVSGTETTVTNLDIEVSQQGR